MPLSPYALLRTLATVAAAVAVAFAGGSSASGSGGAPDAAVGSAVPASSHDRSGQGRCAVPGGTSWVDVPFAGEVYPVRVHVPETRQRGALPMVLDLHFSNGNAEAVSAYNDLDTTADEHGFITVAPNAVIPAADPNPDQIWLWNVPGVPTTAGAYPADDARDDVAFLTAVIDTMTGNGCADPRRVYLTGHSGGARMASAYACAHPEKIAAVAPVAGLRAGRPSPEDPGAIELQSCRPAKPVPVITFHGDADTANPFEGNTDKRWGYTTQLAVQTWARFNSCTTGPRITVVSEHVTRETYGGCSRDAEVELYKVSGGTHGWPGSPQDETATQEVDASELIWQFFAQHRR